MNYTPQDIINQTNQYRAQHGLESLSENPQLSAAAMKRAKDMVTTGNFSHSVATTSPLVNAAAFIANEGYKTNTSAENLARGYNSVPELMDGWKNSPSHNTNLVDWRYKDTGVAVVPRVENGKTTYYIVQLFGMKNDLKKSPSTGSRKLNISPENATPKEEQKPMSFFVPMKGINEPIANSTPRWVIK